MRPKFGKDTTGKPEKFMEELLPELPIYRKNIFAIHGEEEFIEHLRVYLHTCAPTQAAGRKIGNTPPFWAKLGRNSVNNSNNNKLW